MGYDAAQYRAACERKLPPLGADAFVVLLNCEDLEGLDAVPVTGPAARALFRHVLLYRVAARVRFALTAADPQARRANLAAVQALADHARDEPTRWLLVLHPWFFDRRPDWMRAEMNRIRGVLEARGVTPVDEEPVLRARFGKLAGLGSPVEDYKHPNPVLDL